MKRYVIAIFTLLTFSLAGWMNCNICSVEQGMMRATIKQANQGETERQTLKEFGNDIFRLTTEGETISINTNCHTSHHNARQRENFQAKSPLHAYSRQHVGHVTDIINISLYTSSQSNEYYLYTLCRLRI